MTARRAGGGIGSATLLVDAHVHVHEPSAIGRLLDAAAANFARAGARLPTGGQVLGCLMLTEVAGVDCFAALAAGRLGAGGWRIAPTEETVSLVARRPGTLPVLVIAGRQIVSSERIEVLALATRAPIPDGRSLAATIAAAQAADALVVLPWGFGKWWGARGRLVDAYLARAPHGEIVLGDNGGRPIGWPAPRQFARACRRGMLVLPGSDPLPRAGEIERIGRYGFVLRLGLDLSRPAAALRAHLATLERQPDTFGRLQNPARFVASQVALRLRNPPARPASLPHHGSTAHVGAARDDHAGPSRTR